MKRFINLSKNKLDKLISVFPYMDHTQSMPNKPSTLVPGLTEKKLAQLAITDLYMIALGDRLFLP